jgi:hypothetical protein
MASRLELQTLLEDIIGDTNVYFQPPPDYLMSYPCIVYNRSDIRASHGDNRPYKLQEEYTITVIDSNPDSSIPMTIALLPQCSFDRAFATEGLNHSVFKLLY